MFQKTQDYWNSRPFTHGFLLGLVIFFGTYIPITNLWAPELIQIVGQSMFPALENGNRAVFVTKFEEIRRGDIVSFLSPKREAYYCKRVIGLPGDEIIISGNAMVINGQINHEYYVALFSDERTRIINVPLNHYFVMGDNRPYSEDSRYFGCIPRSDINSKLFCKVW